MQQRLLGPVLVVALANVLTAQAAGDEDDAAFKSLLGVTVGMAVDALEALRPDIKLDAIDTPVDGQPDMQNVSLIEAGALQAPVACEYYAQYRVRDGLVTAVNLALITARNDIQKLLPKVVCGLSDAYGRRARAGGWQIPASDGTGTTLVPAVVWESIGTTAIARPTFESHHPRDPNVPVAGISITARSSKDVEGDDEETIRRLFKEIDVDVLLDLFHGVTMPDCDNR